MTPTTVVLKLFRKTNCTNSTNPCSIATLHFRICRIPVNAYDLVNNLEIIIRDTRWLQHPKCPIILILIGMIYEWIYILIVFFSVIYLFFIFIYVYLFIKAGTERVPVCSQALILLIFGSQTSRLSMTIASCFKSKRALIEWQKLQKNLSIDLNS